MSNKNLTSIWSELHAMTSVKNTVLRWIILKIQEENERIQKWEISELCEVKAKMYINTFYCSASWLNTSIRYSVEDIIFLLVWSNSNESLFSDWVDTNPVMKGTDVNFQKVFFKNLFHMITVRDLCLQIYPFQTNAV